VSPFSADEQDGTLTAFLPGGTTAVGFDLMSLGSQSVPPTSPTVCLSTGDCFGITTPDYPGHIFVGFTSTTPINSVAFTIGEGITQPNEVFLDNFAVGTAVPEPVGSSIALGLVALLVVARQSRKKWR
jgi:hypothetical protein